MIRTGKASIVCTPERPKPGERVTLSNADNTGVRAWRWVLRAPVGCELENRPAVDSTTTFVPQTAGVYEVELFVNEGHDFAGQRQRVRLEVGDLSLGDRLLIKADEMQIALEPHQGDDGSLAFKQTEDHIALLREAAAALKGSNILHAALAEVGDKACGIVVAHGGHTIDLLLPASGTSVWVAFGVPDARDENGELLQVDVRGATIQEALDLCARACDEAEEV